MQLLAGVGGSSLILLRLIIASSHPFYIRCVYCVSPSYPLLLVPVCSVTGNAKDIATTAIGWLVFTGFKATAKSVGGILISFAGAFLYSYVGLRKSWATAAASAAAAGAAGASSGSSGAGVVGGSAGPGGKAVTPSIAGAVLPAVGSDVEAGVAAGGDIAEAGAAAGVKKGAGPGEAQARHRGGEAGQRSPREASVGADVEAAHLLAGVSGGALAAVGSGASTGASGVHRDAPISYAEWQATGGYREGGSLSGRA